MGCECWRVVPEILQKANEEAKNQKNETTGLREIAARISSRLSTGGFEHCVVIDTSEHPRRVKYISKNELEENMGEEIAQDLEPLTRLEIEKASENSLNAQSLYRLDAFRSIQKAFKNYFNLDFEIDHARALLNKESGGEHHPNNLQLLLKFHNWKRFSYEEQKEYIKRAISLQNLLTKEMGIVIDREILNSLLGRLKEIY